VDCKSIMHATRTPPLLLPKYLHTLPPNIILSRPPHTTVRPPRRRTIIHLLCPQPRIPQSLRRIRTRSRHWRHTLPSPSIPPTNSRHIRPSRQESLLRHIGHWTLLLVYLPLLLGVLLMWGLRGLRGLPLRDFTGGEGAHVCWMG
jgi:hypothetical protein